MLVSCAQREHCAVRRRRPMHNLQQRNGKGSAQQFEHHRDGGRCRHPKRVEHIEQYNVGHHHSHKYAHHVVEREVLRRHNAVPCTSIIPLLKAAPANTPTAAIVTIVLYFATRAPMAEFRKFTASLLTPTTRSDTARTIRNITIPRNKVFIFPIPYVSATKTIARNNTRMMNLTQPKIL